MTQTSDGVAAPSQVMAGSTNSIRVAAQGSSKLVVCFSSSGTRVTVDVDAAGHAQFELPSTAPAGTVIQIMDAEDPSISASIAIVPASAPQPESHRPHR